MALTAELAAATAAASHRAGARWQRLMLHAAPPRLAVAALLLGTLAHVLGADARVAFDPWPLAGAALAGSGLAWALWAFTLHRAAGNAMRPPAEPLVLVDEGPYRLSRHPMYLGLVSLPFALGLALGSVALLLAGAGLATLLDRLHIAHEERVLARRFGGWWRDYAGSVRRWL